MEPGHLIFLLLTVVMGVVDFAPTVFYWFQSLASRGVARLLGSPLAKRNWKDWVFTVTWLMVGLLSVLISKPPSVFTLFLFLAFKGGADLGAKLIYSIHDFRIVGRRAIGPLALAVAASALPSILFLLTWKAFYHLLLNASAGILGIAVSKLSFDLWLYGLLFGMLFGIFRSMGESGVLLRGELAVVIGAAIP